MLRQLIGLRVLACVGGLTRSMRLALGQTYN